MVDATMLWNDQAGCRPAIWSHAFSAFSPECACVAAKIVCNFYLSSLTHSAQYICTVNMSTLLCNEQWWRTWAGASDPPGGNGLLENVDCQHTAVLPTFYYNLPCNLQTTLCWQIDIRCQPIVKVCQNEGRRELGESSSNHHSREEYTFHNGYLVPPSYAWSILL